MDNKTKNNLSVAFKQDATDQKKNVSKKRIPLYEDEDYMRNLKKEFIAKHNKKCIK